MISAYFHCCMNFLRRVVYEYHDLYDEYVYEISGYKRYQVTEGFPRLTTKDVAPSIKKASYEISLTDLVSFEVS